MALLYSDTFTVTDTPNIDGRTLDNGPGGSESKQWEIVTGSAIGIVSNEAQSFGSAAAAMIHETRTEGDVWVRFRIWSNDTQAIIYCLTGLNRLGPGIGVMMYSRTSLRILLQDDESRYGTYLASQTVDQIALETNYYLRLTKVGSVVTGRLYEDDKTTLLGTVSYDFTSTSFAKEYWGISNYEMENTAFDNYEFYSLDAPPSGGGLLPILMQHGQFNGGLL